MATQNPHNSNLSLTWGTNSLSFLTFLQNLTFNNSNSRLLELFCVSIDDSSIKY